MDEEQLNDCAHTVEEVIRHNVDEAVYQWLREKTLLAQQETGPAALQLAFAAIPRKTRRKAIDLTEDQSKRIAACGNVALKSWTVDMLCRLWLIMKLDRSDKDVYCNKIESLFRSAEMNELVALYSFLPFYTFPEAWQFRTTEGIRSNIGYVLEAIMYSNPYPSTYLPEPAWNQMVLKAFFTDKDVNRIIGLDKRSNKQLAAILVDYAHERWAAGRSVNPQLWRLVAPYIDANNFTDIKRLFSQGDEREKRAAALACSQSNYEPAKRLLDDVPAVNASITENKLHWDLI
jgi:hypothetical protein